MKIFTQSTFAFSSRSFTRFVSSLAFLFVLLCSGLLQAQTSTALYTFSTNTTGSLALLSDGTTAVDMSTGTTQLVAAGNDSAVSALSSIGFTFPLTGSTYTQFYATANGLVTLGATAPSGTLYVTSGGSTTTPRLSAMCADNYVYSTGKVHFKLIGSAPNRCLVIEFLNIATAYLTASAPSLSTWQTRLYENGVIEYVYGGMYAQTSTLCSTCTFTNGFSVGTAANQLASITTSSNTSSTASFTSNTYTQAAAITNLNSASNGSRRVYTYTPPPTYTSVAATDWNTATTWSVSTGGNGVPTAGSTVIVNTNVTAATSPTNQVASITVNNGSTLTLNAAYTNPSGSTITVNSGGALALGGTLTNSGTVTVNGTAQINGGGYASGTAFSYAATGSALIMNHNSGLYGISTGQAFWPTANPPFNVTIQGTGAQINNTVGAVAGTLTVNSQLACAATPSVTVSGTAILAAQLSNTANGNFLSNGTLQINAGGYVSTSAPTYGAASTLVYNSGSASGSPYGVSLEWTGSAAAAGVGIPNNVTIQGNTFITMPNGNRGMSGALNVTAGSGITLNGTSGDLGIGGNFTQNGTLTHSGRAINFFGTTATTQTISGTGLNSTGATNCFAYFLNNTTNTGGVTIGVNATIDGSANDVLQLLNAGPLKIGAFTLTVNGTGGNIRVNGATGGVTKVIDFTSASGILLIKGTTNGSTAKTVSSTSSGVLSVTSSVAGGQVQVQGGGFDCGSALTTIQTGAYMTINSNGYIATNSPTYATGSTLSFRTGGAYGVGSGDKTWGIGTSGAGVPDKVEVNAASTNVTISEDRTARTSVTVTSGTLTNNTSTLSISTGTSAASAVVINGGTYTNGGGTLTIGSAATTTTNALTISSGSLTNSSGTINVATANTTATTVVNITGGTLTNSGGTMNIGASGGGNQALALTAGGLTISSGTVNLNGNAITSGGTFTMSGGNFNIDPNSGTLSTSVGSGTTIWTTGGATHAVTGGTITFVDPPNAGTALTLSNSTSTDYTWTGNTVIFGGSSGTNTTTSTVGFKVDTFVSSGRLFLNNVTINGGNTTDRYTSGPATTSDDFNIGGTLLVNTGSELRNITSGIISCSGDITNNGTFTSIGTMRFAKSSVSAGTIGQTVSGTGVWRNLTASSTASFTAVTTNNTSASGITLGSLTNPLSISGAFTNTAGLIFLGNNDFTFISGSTSFTGSVTQMFVTASGATGALKYVFPASAASGTFPVGENTVTTEYSPFSISFSASSVIRTIGVRVVDANHPNLNDVDTQTDYISRYWQLSNSAAGTYTYTGTATYVAADINGTEGNLKMGLWNGTSPWKQAVSSAASNVLTISTGLTETTGPLSATAEFTGRVKGANTYTWIGGATNTYNTPANWNPSRSVVDATDILVFDGANINGASGTGAITVTAVPTESIGQLKLTGNANVTLQSAAAITLSITGGAGTDLDIPSGSHLQLGSTAANSINLAFTGTQTASIAGQLSLLTNTSNNNTYTATNSVTTVTGTINNFGVVTSTTGNLLMTTGTYKHLFTTTNGTIPTATWSSGSTCSIEGYTTNTTIPGGTTQTFGNFTWNTPLQNTGSINLASNITSITGNLTVISTGTTAARELRYGGTGSTTLNVGGNLDIQGGSFTITSSTGTFTVAVAGNYTQSGGTVDFAQGAGAPTLKVAGTFNQSAGTITESSTGSGTIEFNGAASQAVTISGTISNDINYKVSNPTGIAITGTLAVNAGRTFTAASSGTAVTSGTVTYSTTTTLAYVTAVGSQTTGSEFPSASGPVNVTFNNTFATTPEVTLSGSRTVTGTLTITAGRVLLGNNDLTLANGGTQTVTTPGATKMIVTNGTGLYKRGIPATTGTYLFPIGELTGTVQYSPVSLQFTANSAIRIVGAKVIDAASSNLTTGGTPTNYLSRYWTFSEDGAGGTYNYYINPAVAVTGAEDENGTASLIKAAYWDGATWTMSAGSYTSGSLVSNATGVSETVAPLGTVEWTGRDAPPVSYTWVGFTDGSWNTATNWSPNGVPSSSDTVTLTNGSTGAAANLNLTTAVSVNNLTFNGTGNFFTVGASPAALTVLGTLTYTAGTGTWNATSTFAISSASSQTIPAFAYGNLNGTGGARVWSTGTTGIAGTFTPGAGGYTATSGSTVDFNGASSQTIGAVNYNNLTISGARGTATITLASGTIDVSGSYSVTATGTLSVSTTGNTVNFSSASSQTIPAFVYNNITNTGNGARTLASAGSIQILGTIFTPGSGAYTVTGSTVDYSNATGFTIPTLTPASTNNYNNLTISGAGAFAQGASLTLGGNYSQTAGTYTVTSGASALTLTVGGNFTQSAGTFNVTGSVASAGATVTVTGATSVFAVNMEANASNTASTVLFQANGDATFTGTSTTASLDFMAGGTSGISYNITFGIKGNFNWTGSGKPYTTGSGKPQGFTFNGTGTIASPQTLTYAGAAADYGHIFVVNTGTVVKLLSNIAIGANTGPKNSFTVNGTLDTSTFTVNDGATNGTFTLASGGTLRTANTNGVVSTTVGSVSNTIGTRTFDPAANYEFYGTAAIAANFPNTTMNNLTNSSTNTTTQGASIVVNGNLGLTSGTLASGTNTIALAGNITGTGTHTSSGVGILTMSGASKTISGATLGIVTLNNAAGFSLTGSPTLNGNLTFTNGNLDLNGSNNITLGTTVTVTGETCSKQFTNTGSPTQGNGYVQTTRTLAANPGNIANLGLNVQTATALGSTNLKRFVQKGVSSVGNTNSIKRVYSITPTTAATGNVTLTSSYCDGELNGNTESTPVLVTYYGTGTNETTGYSSVYATASNDATANTVTTPSTGTLIAGQNNITLANAGPDAYYTVQDGDWNTASTWVLNAVPPAGVPTIIKNLVTVNGTVTNASSSITINSAKSLTFGASGTITTTNLTNNGSVVMTSGGTLTIASGGTFANGTNTFTGGSGTVKFAGTGTITGTTTFNNVTINNGVDFGVSSTIGSTGILQLNSGGYAANNNSPLFASGSTLKYNAGGGSGSKYNQSFEWPVTNGPSNVVIDNNSWVQLTANRSLAGNLTVTNGALQSLGANTLTLNGTSQTATISESSGGAIYGTDNGFGNDLSLVISSGTTTLTGDATSSLDDAKKFINVTVNSGATLALSRGILCKYGAFALNGTLQINANGYVQNDTSYGTNAKLPAYNSTTGALIYNNGGSYTNGGEWLSTNSPFNVTIQNNSAVVLSDDRTINGTLTLTAGTLELGTKNLTIGATGTITASSPSASTMIIASGSGQLRKSFSTTGSFTYPIGDNTGTAEYSPVTLNFTAGSLAGYAGVNVTNAKKTNNTSATDYINRYWTVATSGITSPTCTASFVYVDADIVGTESNLYGGRYLSSTWNCMDAVTTATNTISKVITSFGDFTAGEVSLMGCCANPTSGGTIAVAQTICSGTAPTAFTSSALPSGQSGTLEYKWQSSTTSSSSGFSDISGATATTYSPGILTATTWFKRLSKVTCSDTWSTNGESNVIQITVTPSNTVTLTSASGTDSQTVCLSSGITTITYATTGATGATVTGLPTGVTGSWSGNVVTISGAPSVTAGSPYTYTVTLTGGCGSITTTGTVTVTAPPSAGTLSGTQAVCASGTTTFASTVSGGAWSSSDSGVATIDASTGVVTPVAAGTATMTYTVAGTGGCSDATATRTVTVNSTSVAGTVSSDQMICSGNSATVSLSGYTGTIQWQQSLNGTSGWANVTGGSGATTSSYTTPNLTVTTYYRAIVTSGVCSAATSGTVTITVNPLPTITLSYIDDVLPTDTSFSIPYTATTGSPDQYSIVTSTVGGGTNTIVMPGFTAVTNATLGSTPISVTIPASSAAEYGFVLTVTNSTTGCSKDYSFQFHVTSVNHGVIGTDQTICSGATPAPLTSISDGSSTFGSITYTWEKSTSINTGYLTISGETGAGYSPGALTQTTYFKRVTHYTGTNPDVASDSDPVTITVNPLPQGSLSANGPFCVTGSGQLTFTATAGTGPFTLVYNDGIADRTTTNIVSGTAFDVYTTPVVASTTYTLVSVTDASSTTCARTSGFTTGSATITVNPVTDGGTASSDQTICSGETPSAITLASSVGSVVKWQSSSDAAFTSPTDITNTSTTLTLGSLSATTYYRAVVQSGACSSANSNVVTLTVNSLPTVSIASNNSPVCSGAASFSLTGTTDAVVTYSINGGTNATTTLTGGAATISVPNPFASQVLTLVSVANNGCTSSLSDTSTVSVFATTYNGTSWSNGDPDSSKLAIFTGNYTIAADLTACSLRVTNNAVVTVNSTYNVNLNGAITVDSGSSFTMNNNSNLFQADASAVNTGNIVVKRNTSTIVRLDHTLWSSPVTGQNLFSFSPNTLVNRFYVYNTATNSYVTTGLSNTSLFTPAKGFAVRAPNNQSATTPAVWTGTFTGVPNNGTKTFTLATDAANGYNYNLVGNPYPSAISASDFYAANSSKIGGTLYFYAHTLSMNASGVFPTGTNYATWTGLGGAAATAGDGHTAAVAPNGIIQVGQGFIVKATASGDVTFTNSMRVANQQNQFMKAATTTPELHRMWLNLKTDTGVDINQILVGYIDGATQGVDAGLDGLSFGNSGSYLYSKIDNNNYVIQARSLPFDITDEVPLGFNCATTGSYSISLTNTDGLFAGSQDVLVRDNLTGTDTSIKTAPYTFTSDAGVFDTRFRLVYTQALGVPSTNFTENSVIVYKNTDWFHVTTKGIEMKDIMVYDISGRLIYSQKDINATTAVLNGLSTTNQVLLLKITSTEDKTVTIKVIN